MIQRRNTVFFSVCLMAAIGCGSEETGYENNGSGGAGGDAGDTATSGAGAGSGGFDGSSGSSAGGTGGDSGAGGQTEQSFFCGSTECTSLAGSPITGFLEYCCTPSNACSTRVVGVTDCPDPVVCGGEECASFPAGAGTMVGVGTACCSPSDKCSFMAPGDTVCPEPDELDPECPDLDEVMGTSGGFTGIGMPGFDTRALGGEGWCLPDNVCGYVFFYLCRDPRQQATTVNGVTLYDCDGNLISTPEPDAGSADSGSPDAGVTS